MGGFCYLSRGRDGSKPCHISLPSFIHLSGLASVPGNPTELYLSQVRSGWTLCTVPTLASHLPLLTFASPKYRAGLFPHNFLHLFCLKHLEVRGVPSQQPSTRVCPLEVAEAQHPDYLNCSFPIHLGYPSSLVPQCWFPSASKCCLSGWPGIKLGHGIETGQLRLLSSFSLISGPLPFLVLI